jgi:hypothetical protein
VSRHRVGVFLVNKKRSLWFWLCLRWDCVWIGLHANVRIFIMRMTDARRLDYKSYLEVLGGLRSMAGGSEYLFSGLLRRHYKC